MSQALSFNNLRYYNRVRQREWNTGVEKVSPLFRAVELAGEVGEALNVLKKLEQMRLGIKGTPASLSDLADELADAIICIDLLSEQMGIDLDHAVKDKFNRTSNKYGLKTKI